LDLSRLRVVSPCSSVDLRLAARSESLLLRRKEAADEMGGGGGEDGKANMSMGKKALVDILSGTAGGFAQVVAGHPVS
jgi:hypothetical protein